MLQPTISVLKTELKIAANLPAKGRARLRRLADDLADRRAIRSARVDEMRDASAERDAAMVAVGQLTEPVRFGVHDTRAFDDRSPEVVRAKARLATAQEKYERLRARLEGASAAVEPLGQLEAALIEFIERVLPSGAPPPKASGAPETAKPRKEIAAAVAEVREALGLARDELARVLAAPITSTSAKAKIAAEVGALATRGRADASRLVETGAAIIWPEIRRVEELFVQGNGIIATSNVAINTADTVGLLAWLFRDRLVEALNAEVDEVADDAGALTDDERAAHAASLRAQILELQRRECDLVDMSDGAVVHRADIDPRAFLDLADTLPAAEDLA